MTRVLVFYSPSQPSLAEVRLVTCYFSMLSMRCIRLSRVNMISLCVEVYMYIYTRKYYMDICRYVHIYIYTDTCIERDVYILAALMQHESPCSFSRKVLWLQRQAKRRPEQGGHGAIADCTPRPPSPSRL